MRPADIQQRLEEMPRGRNLAESDGISESEFPRCNPSAQRGLRRQTESPESNLQSYACAHTRVGGSRDWVRESPQIPETPLPLDPTPAAALWTALRNRENVYAVADRLGLSPEAGADSWRLDALRVAKTEAFWDARPSDVPLTREDWQRWRRLKESPRKMLDLLRKLIYGVRLWD